MSYPKAGRFNTPLFASIVVPIATSFIANPVCHAQPAKPSLWDMSLAELMDVEVTLVATGSPAPLNRAAAVTTVITSADLRNMGAKDIDDALMTVPGLYVSRSDQVYTPMYIFRGIYGSLNPQALLLINGLPQKTLVYGNRGDVWGGLPVEAIERIEIIRGPGSALYGADAFAGVINIVTKSNREIQGVQSGIRAGSFAEKDAWVQYGGQVAEWDTFFSLEIGTTDGHDGTVDADTQTTFDYLAAALDPDPNYVAASNAPGSINTAYKNLDLNLDLSHEGWRAWAGYSLRDDVALGVGIADALTPSSYYKSERANLDLSYAQDVWQGDLNLVSQLSLYYGSMAPKDDTLIFPAGAKVPDTCTLIATCLPTFYYFPEGYIGSPGYREMQASFTQYGVYSGWNDHRLRVVAGFTWGDVFETTEAKNFNANNSPRADGIVDVSDTNEVWLPEENRDAYFLALQDEWQMAHDWQLVTGLRYDRYSDFGDTLNPRLALIWQTSRTLTTRFLYGRAFRAPSFSELYATANPVALGNESLDPEIIDTYEIALYQALSAGSHYGFNVFYYRIDDMILLTSQHFTNIGERRGKGFEFEFQNKLDDNFTLSGNYAYQKSEDMLSHEDVGNAPNQQAYLSLNWARNQDWNVNLEYHWIGAIERAPGDINPIQGERDPLPSASLWNLTVRQMGLAKGLELALNLRNIFDRDWATPSANGAGVVNDYPAPGRNGNVTLRYEF